MRTLLHDVSAFHNATDCPVLEQVILPPLDRIELRLSLITEEVRDELLQHLIDLKFARAIVDRHRDENKTLPPEMVELIRKDAALLLDAMADSIYVIVGTALEFGLPLDKCWDIVQRANMGKVDSTTGKVRRREDGKILKPDGWVPPDEQILALIPHVRM
jgi:predicted HAD superfamily Cof-like phosphohydrolase